MIDRFRKCWQSRENCLFLSFAPLHFLTSAPQYLSSIGPIDLLYVKKITQDCRWRCLKISIAKKYSPKNTRPNIEKFLIWRGKVLLHCPFWGPSCLYSLPSLSNHQSLLFFQFCRHGFGGKFLRKTWKLSAPLSSTHLFVCVTQNSAYHASIKNGVAEEEVLVWRRFWRCFSFFKVIFWLKRSEKFLFLGELELHLMKRIFSKWNDPKSFLQFW